MRIGHLDAADKNRVGTLADRQGHVSVGRYFGQRIIAFQVGCIGYDVSHCAYRSADNRIVGRVGHLSLDRAARIGNSDGHIGGVIGGNVFFNNSISDSMNGAKHLASAGKNMRQQEASGRKRTRAHHLVFDLHARVDHAGYTACNCAANPGISVFHMNRRIQTLRFMQGKRERIGRGVDIIRETKSKNMLSRKKFFKCKTAIVPGQCGRSSGVCGHQNPRQGIIVFIKNFPAYGTPQGIKIVRFKHIFILSAGGKHKHREHYRRSRDGEPIA